MYNELIDKALALHKDSKFDEAEKIYQRLLNRSSFNEDLLFLLSDLYMRREWNGLAVNLLSNLLQNNPKNANAWCNLGTAFRKENNYDLAKSAWQKAIETGGETVEVCSNFAGLYADRSMPQQAIEWCDKALKLDGNSVHAKWQKSLALLSLKQWAEGWKLYSHRQQLDGWDSRKSIDVPLWDGKPVRHLYIHGEQGVGDEIMFAAYLNRVKAEKVTIEVHEKVAPIIRLTWPHFNVVTEETPGDYDAKVPMGSLAAMFSCDGNAYLKPDPARVAYYRRKLAGVGPGPHIAIAWVGGTKVTRIEDRSICLSQLKPILAKYTCVSAQYSDTNPVVEQERLAVGLHKINDECTGLDLAEQAALFAACDAVVTVQQTAVHVAGAVGAKCLVMLSSNPHWRYGVEGDALPWYDSVKLIRNKTGWDDVLARTLKELKKC